MSDKLKEKDKADKVDQILEYINRPYEKLTPEFDAGWSALKKVIISIIGIDHEKV